MYRSLKQWKYQLLSGVSVSTIWRPKDIIRSSHGWIEIYPNGTLIVKKGYAWDGPSGLTIDTETFMRGSLFHDALYQLMREGLLPQEDREKTDQLLRKICKEDGMNSLRRRYVYRLVRMFGAKNAKPKN